MPLWTLARESKDKENGFEGRGEGIRIPGKTTEGAISTHRQPPRRDNVQGHHPDREPNSLSCHSHHPLRSWVLELLPRMGLRWEAGIRDDGEPSCHFRVPERCQVS